MRIQNTNLHSHFSFKEAGRHSRICFTFPSHIHMSPTSVGPARLGILLSEAWSFCTAYWKPILTAALVLGAVSAVVNSAIAVKTADRVNGMMQNMGMDAERVQDLSLRIQQGDESAVAEMEALVQANFGENADQDTVSRAIGLNMLKTVGPAVGLAGLVGGVFSVLALAFYITLALWPIQNAQVTASTAAKSFIPLLGLMIWIFIRTFAWIPFIGAITAIVLGPRFALAPVIMLQEKKSIMDSASSSYARSRGYWGKIIGNTIVAAICMIPVVIVVSMVAGLAGFIFPLAGLWLKESGNYLALAFSIMFSVRLALTIMANPMGIVSAAPVTPVKVVAAKPVATVKKKK